MNDATTLLEVRDLAKHFVMRRAVVKAVDGVSFTLDPGRTLALVGESGCGKTTTAKLILHLETPSAGEVRLDGQNVHRLDRPGLRRFRTEVQAVFQDPWSSLNPRMRVREIVAEPLICNRKLARKELDRHVDEALTAVGLRPAHKTNYPHEFSGGQRQRIAIASALISRPKLLVLDEPVSALDVSIRSQIMNLFKDLQAEFGMSYLIVAHDLGTTRYMADDIAVMYLGRIVEIGAAEDIFNAPRHPYTRALLAAALPAHPDIAHEEVELGGEIPSPLDPPAGCHFHPRCPDVLGELCRTSYPALARRRDCPSPVSCHLYDEVQIPLTAARIDAGGERDEAGAKAGHGLVGAGGKAALPADRRDRPATHGTSGRDAGRRP